MKREYIFGLVAIVIIAAIGIGGLLWHNGKSAKAPATPAPPTAALSPPPAPAPAPPAASDKASIPSFDIVRVDPRGGAVIAGRAATGDEVTVYEGDNALGKATADAQGSWALVLDQPLPPGQRQLSLAEKSAKDGTITKSDGVVAMLVPDRPAAGASPQAQTPASTQAGTPAGQSPAPGQAPASASAQAQAQQAAAEPAPGPVAVLLPSKGGAKVLQLPVDAKGKSRLALDMIEYDHAGTVTLSGRSAPHAKIEAFLGKKSIGTAVADDNGAWSLTPKEDVPAARYQLHIEAHSADGALIAEQSTPFERAVPPSDISGVFTTVQPGNSLWRIARLTYGSGVHYVEIYQANRPQIQNPNVIFPGQFITVPPQPEASKQPDQKTTSKKRKHHSNPA